MVQSLWDDQEAAECQGDLAQRVYSSNLLGRDPDLVLHGGGNTSVKSRHTTLFGEEVDVLLVKGSGSDLADIEESGFVSLRLHDVTRLVELESLSDTEMAQQLLLAATAPGGPAPSVEAILHAILPQKFVDHTHADAVVTLTNSAAAKAALEEVYGDDVIVVPYVMPGFKLARACAELLSGKLTADVLGVVLMNHGIFTFAETAKDAYERMIALVSRAEAYVEERRPRRPAVTTRPAPSRVERAALRRAVSDAVGDPVIVSSHADDEVVQFIARPDLETVSQRGTITPEHVIRTKPWPLLGRDVEAFCEAYRRYFDAHRSRATTELQPLDPAPRVVLDPDLGMCCVGRTAKDAKIVQDIYRHTMKVITDATELGGYEPVPLPDLFDVEYWDLEQAKLRRAGTPPPLSGEVALVTGAASGIGRACADALMKAGAAVVGLDVNPEIESAFEKPHQWLGLVADVSDADQTDAALEAAAEGFGGLDILVLNAGVFPATTPIAELDRDTWRGTMAVNVDANASLLRAAHPLLRLAPRGGRVVVIGSKNVPAPGPGAAAYSASKAALTQLARVAALEWGKDGIRVNVVHPNAVFDTGVWTPEVLEERAASYGMPVDEYRRKTLLGVEVTSGDVARVCVTLCGPDFAKTTGAQIPVDGGNERVV